MHTCHAILSKGSLCRVHRLLPLHYEVLAFNFVNFSIFIAISCYRDYLLNPWHYKYDHLYLYKFLVYTVYKNLMSFVKFYLHIIILFILSSLHHTSSILLPSVKREPLFCFHVYVHIQKHLDPLVKENIDYLVFLRPSLLTVSCSLFIPSAPNTQPTSYFYVTANRPPIWCECAVLIILNISYFIELVYLHRHRFSCKWGDFLLLTVNKPLFCICFISFMYLRCMLVLEDRCYKWCCNKHSCGSMSVEYWFRPLWVYSQKS